MSKNTSEQASLGLRFMQEDQVSNRGLCCGLVKSAEGQRNMILIGLRAGAPPRRLRRMRRQRMERAPAPTAVVTATARRIQGRTRAGRAAGGPPYAPGRAAAGHSTIRPPYHSIPVTAHIACRA